MFMCVCVRVRVCMFVVRNLQKIDHDKIDHLLVVLVWVLVKHAGEQKFSRKIALISQWLM